MIESVQVEKSGDWLKVVVFGSGARIFALGSQFVVLVILSHIMSKELFGNMMIVFALYRMLSLGVGTGIGNMILYHVGRSGGNETLDVRLHRSSTLAALVVSTLLAVVVIALSGELASLYDKPGLVMWLVHMAPFLVFSTLNFVAMGSLDGRSRITSSIIITEVLPNGMRLVGLPLIALFDLPPVAAAHVMWVSVAVPWLIAFLPALRSKVLGFQRLTLWDARYTGLYALTTVASLQLQGIDMLVVGAFFTSEQAAGYAIASRLATLFPFFQLIILKNFTPRAGHLIHHGDKETLNRELSSIRHWSMISVGALTGVILLSSPIAFMLFGNFRDEVPILVALALPMLIRSLFPGIDVILKMSGRASSSFAVAMASATLVYLVPLASASILGIYSVPLGMLVSTLLINPVIAVDLTKRGIKILELKDLPIPLIGCICACVALTQKEPWLVGGISGVGCFLMAMFAYGYLKKQI